MRIRPCIDIHDGKVKQIVGGTLRAGAGNSVEENFVSARDAAFYAGLYRERNLPGGHIILLNSRTAEPQEYSADLQQALAALRAWPGGMQVGGGITPENAGVFLDAGASHVIVTSYVFRNGTLDLDHLLRMEQAVGREHLVLDLSCRRWMDRQKMSDCPGGQEPTDGREDHVNNADAWEAGEASESVYRVVTDRWQKWTDLVLSEETLSRLSMHCDEFLIHAADVEGRRQGIETELVHLLGGWLETTPFPVTYAGGVHTLSDLDVLREASDGRMDFTVGSALDLFGGSLSLEALEEHLQSLNAG